MKAKNRLMGLLCLKLSPRDGALVLLILLANSCPNRPALAQSTCKRHITIKLPVINCYKVLLRNHQRTIIE